MPKMFKNGDNGTCPERIDPALLPLAVPVRLLKPDPDNANLHPEVSIEVIKESYRRFGQKKPIVVRKETMTVVAGNGQLEAAIALGWARIAANVVSMTDVEAMGYGLADNRSAQLSHFDFEVVARLERLLAEAGEPAVGWTDEEIRLLRAEIAEKPVPDSFPEMTEDIDVQHVCPKCGYAFSGGKTVPASGTES